MSKATATSASAAGGGEGGAANTKKMNYQTIYPQYLDSALTPKLGRRLTHKQSVAHPSLQEIFEAARALGFTDLFADPIKSLPRAQSQAYCIPPLRGCIKIAIKEPAAQAKDPEHRKAVNEKCPNKSEVLRQIADKIRSIPNRQVRAQSAQQAHAAKEAEMMSEHLAKKRTIKMPGGGGRKQKVKVIRR